MTAPAGAGALAGLRVLDLSTGIAGQFCAKLLAGYGAEVVLAEPPGGTATRLLGPRLPGGESALFRHLNQGKASVAAGPEADALAAGADVIIRDQHTAAAPAAAPGTVECVIREFPQDGPYAGWQGSELVHQALCGAMYATGRPDSEPLYGIGHRAYYATGTTACISVLAALHERASSGLGQRVTATVFEACAAIGQNLVSQHSYNGTFETRRRYPGFLAMLRCADHWMVLFAVRYWEQLCAAFGLPELARDERLATQAGRLEHWDDVVDRLQEQAAARPAAELVAALQRARISSEVITPVGDLIASPQWQARRILRQVSDAAGRTEAALGPPFTVGDTGYHALSPSPSAPAGVPAQRWQSAVPAAAVPAAGGPAAGGSRAAGGPLSGIRVLDLTTAWAGPLAARSLAWLGAQVIKIDAPSHADSWRGAPDGGAPRHYPDGQPGARPWNRCVLFNTQGQGKWSLGLDLKVAGAREVFLALAAISDIVIANFAPGVLERLGIGYADLSAVNPRVIVAEMPAFGPGGPDSAHQGMGKTMEAATGMAALMGYGDGVPSLTGPAYLDPVGGLNAAAAALTALAARQRAGTGCRVEVPQTEAGVHWIGEYLLEQAETGQTWQPRGNAVSYAAPHDAYPCQGEDAWVAIAAVTGDHVRALCELTGAPAGTSPAELAGPVGEWTRLLDKHEAARLLQAAGIPAAPVCTGADVSTDAGLRAAGLIRELTHPEAGRHAYPGLAYRLSRTPGGFSTPAPRFGEQNELVLRVLLALSGEDIAQLLAAGAVSDRPAAAQPGRGSASPHSAATSGGTR